MGHNIQYLTVNVEPQYFYCHTVYALPKNRHIKKWIMCMSKSRRKNYLALQANDHGIGIDSSKVQVAGDGHAGSVGQPLHQVLSVLGRSGNDAPARSRKFPAIFVPRTRHRHGQRRAVTGLVSDGIVDSGSAILRRGRVTPRVMRPDDAIRNRSISRSIRLERVEQNSRNKALWSCKRNRPTIREGRKHRMLDWILHSTGYFSRKFHDQALETEKNKRERRNKTVEKSHDSWNHSAQQKNSSAIIKASKKDLL